MKKSINLMALFAVAAMLISCGSSQTGQVAVAQQPSNPFAVRNKMPHAAIDTDEYFAATGIGQGSYMKLAEVYELALANGQNIIHRKMKHAFDGLATSYLNSVGTNAGNDIESRSQRVVDHVIKGVLNDTKETREAEYTNPDDKGNITCFLSLQVNKSDVSDKVADAILDVVSEDEELRIAFKEEEFRKFVEEKAKAFKEK